MIQRPYIQEAKSQEGIFREILKDMKENRETRPMGYYIPEDLDTTSPVEDICKKYSEGVRFGVFTILNFKKLDEKTASIMFQDIAVMSGGGAELIYEVDGNEVRFRQSGIVWRS